MQNFLNDQICLKSEHKNCLEEKISFSSWLRSFYMCLNIQKSQNKHDLVPKYFNRELTMLVR